MRKSISNSLSGGIEKEKMATPDSIVIQNFLRTYQEQTSDSNLTKCTTCTQSFDISKFISTANGCKTKTCFDCRESGKLKLYSSPAQVLYRSLRENMPPCVLCGDSDISHLEYDHINPLEKIDCVCNMTTTESMMAELTKCRSLCKKCHRKVTYEQQREDMSEENVPKTHKSRSINDMRILINSYKLAQGKCSNVNCAQLVTEDSLTFFEYDHIDPLQKRLGIGSMIAGNYSMESILEELKLCQLLCGYCHKIKTISDRDVKSTYYKSLSMPLPRKEKKFKLRTEEDVKEIRRLYNSYELYQNEIADLYNVHLTTISNIISNITYKDPSYVRIRTDPRPKRHVLTETEAIEILNIFKVNPETPLTYLMDKYDCSRDQLVKLISRLSIVTEHRVYRETPQADVEKIIAMHKSGVTVNAISKFYGFDSRKTEKILKTGSGTIFGRDARLERNANIINDHKTGQYTSRALAEKYKISKSTVNVVLKKQ